MNKYIPVNRPLLDGNEKKYVCDAIDSGWISSDGPFVELFEQKFAKSVGRKYGIAVSNGTAALEVSIRALGIKKGDEVIIPSFTIISCAIAVVNCGATPIFIDCYRDTWNINVDQIEERITKKTKAIMAVHIYGLPAEMNKIIAIAKRHGLLIIEDAAEAHGQKYYGKSCGSFGKVSTFSFYANKHLTTGEGGMILTDNFEIAQKCKKLRNLCFEPSKRFYHRKLGWNYRLTNLQAAVGLAQLETLSEHIEKKIKIGATYQSKLNNCSNVETPVYSRDGYMNNYWVYGVILKKETKMNATEVMKNLHKKGVGTRPFFWPLHLQPVFKPNNIRLKNSEYISKFGFYLPSGVGTTIDEVEKSSDILIDILK